MGRCNIKKLMDFYHVDSIHFCIKFLFHYICIPHKWRHLNVITNLIIQTYTFLLKWICYFANKEHASKERYFHITLLKCSFVLFQWRYFPTTFLHPILMYLTFRDRSCVIFVNLWNFIFRCLGDKNSLDLLYNSIS